MSGNEALAEATAHLRDAATSEDKLRILRQVLRRTNDMDSMVALRVLRSIGWDLVGGLP